MQIPYIHPLHKLTLFDLKNVSNLPKYTGLVLFTITFAFALAEGAGIAGIMDVI